MDCKVYFTRRAVSAQIMTIFKSITSLVEPLSLDEAYLDITSNVSDFPEAVQLARTIKERISEETGLTASAGVSFNKLLSKLASDAHKPDGLTVISPEQAPACLEALSIDKFVGVGKVTATKLRELGDSTRNRSQTPGRAASACSAWEAQEPALSLCARGG